MKNNGMKIKHPKLRGEWAEMCFMARAAEHGLSVTRPWGEMSRYDFAVEYKGRFVRVQVKSTMFLDRGGYTVTVRGWRGKYTGDPFDFVAAYLIPLDIWYILPVESFKMQGNVGLYPKLKKSKYGGLRRLGICCGVGPSRTRWTGSRLARRNWERRLASSAKRPPTFGRTLFPILWVIPAGEHFRLPAASPPVHFPTCPGKL